MGKRQQHLIFTHSPGGVSELRRCAVSLPSVPLLAVATEGGRCAEERITFARGNQREERTGLARNPIPHDCSLNVFYTDLCGKCDSQSPRLVG